MCIYIYYNIYLCIQYMIWVDFTSAFVVPHDRPIFCKTYIHPALDQLSCQRRFVSNRWKPYRSCGLVLVIFPIRWVFNGGRALTERSVMVRFFVCWKQSNQPQCRCHPPHNCHYPFFKLRYVWCESSIKWDKPKAPPFQDDKNLYDCLEVSPDFETKPGFFMSSSGLSHYLQLGNNPATGMLQVMLGWSSFLWLNL